MIAVLGATGSVGRDLCDRLTKRGERVLLAGRNVERLAALSRELGQPWTAIEFTDSASVEQALSSSLPPQERLTGVVNCIGSVLLKPAHATTDDEFRAVIESNLFSSFAAVRAASRLMRTEGGSVILFASAAAEIGIANHEAIAAAKAGVIGLARSAAATYAPNNIRVNVISPGLVRSEMTRRLWENPSSAATSGQMHPLGRLGEPRHPASLAAWLLDPQNDWITGQVIGVDGGLGHLLARR